MENVVSKRQTKRPHIGLAAKSGVVQHLRGGPLDRKFCTYWTGVLIIQDISTAHMEEENPYNKSKQTHKHAKLSLCSVVLYAGFTLPFQSQTLWQIGLCQPNSSLQPVMKMKEKCETA